MNIPTKITFFEWLTPSIKAGKKTITIRDSSESHYIPNTCVKVFTLEKNEYVCDIKIISVDKICYEDINQHHAEQEFMSLEKLKQLIREIYPNEDEFFVITYQKID